MRTKLLAVCLVSALLVMASEGALAQYIFLDSDRDGANSATDHLSRTGQTWVDIWLDTARTKAGAEVACAESPGKPMSMFSYEIALSVSDGTVEWGSYENYQSTMNLLGSIRKTDTEYHCFYGGMSILPAGRYKLGRLAVRVSSGEPRVEVVHRLDGARHLGTSFGSECPGVSGTQTIRYAGGTGATIDKAASAARLPEGTWRDAGHLGPPATGVMQPAQWLLGGPHVQVVSTPDSRLPSLVVSTTKTGFLRVKLFDVHGRLVGYPINEQEAEAGVHRVLIAGRTGGKPLPSGVYVFRVETSGGMLSGRVAIVK